MAAEVYAPMSGSVALFFAEDGALVSEGDQIIAIECFKTFFPITAPVSGKITFICHIGQIVGENDLLAMINP